VKRRRDRESLPRFTDDVAGHVAVHVDDHDHDHDHVHVHGRDHLTSLARRDKPAFPCHDSARR
jgi:hypothetical protein